MKGFHQGNLQWQHNSLQVGISPGEPPYMPSLLWLYTIMVGYELYQACQVMPLELWIQRMLCHILFHPRGETGPSLTTYLPPLSPFPLLEIYTLGAFRHFYSTWPYYFGGVFCCLAILCSPLLCYSNTTLKNAPTLWSRANLNVDRSFFDVTRENTILSVSKEKWIVPIVLLECLMMNLKITTLLVPSILLVVTSVLKWFLSDAR